MARESGTVVDPSRLRERRLLTQGLGLPARRSATEAVRLLAAVQSQEPAHAFWSLALRSDATTEVEVRAAYDAGEFLRTHVLRPTWHFVAAEDLRWLLATTAPRVHQTNASLQRKQGLTHAHLDRAAGVIADALGDHTPRTRQEVVIALAEAGLPTTSLDVVLLIMHAELEQVVVSGPMRGAAHTYALFDDRIAPATTTVDPDPTRLLRRFLEGHCPASVRDFARWSSLTLTVARRALDDLRDELRDDPQDDFELLELDGETYVSLPPERPGTMPTVLLLPLYDELLLAYRDLAFPPVAGHPHQPGTDLFVGSVIAGDANLGTWRREVKAGGVKGGVRGRTVEVRLDLAPGTPERLVEAARAQARRLADFLQGDLVL